MAVVKSKLQNQLSKNYPNFPKKTLEKLTNIGGRGSTFPPKKQRYGRGPVEPVHAYLPPKSAVGFVMAYNNVAKRTIVAT